MSDQIDIDDFLKYHEDSSPPDAMKYPVMLVVPRQLDKIARALQHALGSKQLLVIPFGGALMGYRVRSIVILKPELDEREQVSYDLWFNGNVKQRLVLGCEKNISVVEV